MKAGSLKHRVKFYKKVSTRSPTGAVKTASWEHVLTLSASFEPLSVKDVISGQAAGTNITARCQIRYYKDITHDMRVWHAGTNYEIVGEPLPDKNSGREYITLMLRNVTNENRRS